MSETINLFDSRMRINRFFFVIIAIYTFLKKYAIVSKEIRKKKIEMSFIYVLS